jgi:peptide/nickel transport system permease protein
MEQMKESRLFLRASGQEEVLSREPTYTQLVVKGFLRHRTALVGLIIITIFTVLSVLGPSIVPYDPAAIDLSARLQFPSPRHWLGTDELGRDILSRIIIGSRITLVITVFAVLIALVVGSILGAIAGYYGGVIDAVISRFIDLLMTLPGFLLAIAIIAILGVGTFNVILAVGIYSIPTFARIARGSTLSVKGELYVLASIGIGASDIWILRRHIAPNILPPLIVQTSLRLATAILTASSLSFLGLGPQPPTPEWGAMLASGRNFIASAPLLVLFPGLAIFFVALSFNLLGDGLRDALDPHRVR